MRVANSICIIDANSYLNDIENVEKNGKYSININRHINDIKSYKKSIYIYREVKI